MSIDTSLVFYPEQMQMKRDQMAQEDRRARVQEELARDKVSEFDLSKAAEISTLKAARGIPLDENDHAVIEAYSALKGGGTYTDAFGNVNQKPTLSDNLRKTGRLGDLMPTQQPAQDFGRIDEFPQNEPRPGFSNIGSVMSEPLPAPTQASSNPPALPGMPPISGQQINMGDLQSRAQGIPKPVVTGPAAGTPVAQKAEMEADLALQKDVIKDQITADRDATKFNDGQGKAATFADRMMEANDILGTLNDAQTSVGENVKGMLPGVGNFLTSSDYQKAAQAQQNFINATLRRESGASISPGEFANARQQYFPQPGDSPEVIAQKAQNRQTVISGFSREAGPAYKPKKSDQPNQAVDYSEYFK